MTQFTGRMATFQPPKKKEEEEKKPGGISSFFRNPIRTIREARFPELKEARLGKEEPKPEPQFIGRMAPKPQEETPERVAPGFNPFASTEPLSFGTQTSTPAVVQKDDIGLFSSQSFKHLKPSDVGKATVDVAKAVGKIGKEFIPARVEFVKTMGKIFGEGLAYGISALPFTDNTVKEQYLAGNLDILPTISNTTQKDLAKLTFAAGLETAVFRSLPLSLKMKLPGRVGVEALAGLGFAISRGIAMDKTIEEIMKEDALEFGVGGAVLGVISPYLMILMRSEMKNLPKEVRAMFKGLHTEFKGAPPPRQDLPLRAQFPSEPPTKVPVKTGLDVVSTTPGARPVEVTRPSVTQRETPTPRVTETPNLTTSISQAKASGQTFDEGVKGQELAQTLRGTKGMTAEDIMKTHPDIRLKKDVPATDIYGNKVKIPEGEALTPYELKGNKVLLQDGETYIVSKSQFQNIKGNAVSKEAKEFAPELKGLEESVRSDVKLPKLTESQVELLDRKYARGEITQAEFNRQMGTDRNAKFSQYQLPGGKNYKEILIKAPESFKQGEYGTEVIDTSKRFRSSHWDEPNVISHLRLNEHTVKGKKITFMEESQSDWQLAIRKGEKVPPLPTKEPHVLNVKRGLQEAVANDSDYFAWITGEQTSARYDLSKPLKKAEWKTIKAGADTGNKEIILTPKEGREIVPITLDKNGKIIDTRREADWIGKTLDQAIGKGLADSIMAKESGTLSGEGLKFGGEWANNLYDKQIKNIVEKVTGGKVVKLDMGLPIEKNTRNLQLKTKNFADIRPLKTTDLKVGTEILDGSTPAVIFRVLGEGKFEAISKEQLNLLKKQIDEIAGVSKIKKPTTLDEYIKFAEDREMGLDTMTETFDISTKTTTQQGIRLTPEIKARIRGEAPDIKTSGKQFEDTRSQLKAERDKIGKADATPTTPPKETTSTGFSRHFERIKGDLDAINESVTFERINIKDQARRSFELIEKSPQDAMKMAYGLKRTPEGINPQALRISMIESLKASGKTAQARALAKETSLQFTRSAQELNIAKLDIGTAGARRIESVILGERLEKLGNRLPSMIDSRTGKAMTPKEAALRKIKTDSVKAAGEVKVAQRSIYKTADDLLRALTC